MIKGSRIITLTYASTYLGRLSSTHVEIRMVRSRARTDYYTGKRVEKFILVIREDVKIVKFWDNIYMKICLITGCVQIVSQVNGFLLWYVLYLRSCKQACLQFCKRNVHSTLFSRQNDNILTNFWRNTLRKRISNSAKKKKTKPKN